MAINKNDFVPSMGEIEGVRTWKMPTFVDERGSLSKSFIAGAKGSFPLEFEIVEHFFTRSRESVFRGMHFQGKPHEVSKVISIIKGKARDFLWDLRHDSVSFGHVLQLELTEEQPISILVPSGVAHGYVSLANDTIISYMYNGVFCINCDSGVSGKSIEAFLPIGFENAIKSEKDAYLNSIENFVYTSKCAT